MAGSTALLRHLLRTHFAMAPKASGRCGAPGPTVKRPKVKQPKVTYQPEEYICRMTKKWLKPLPVHFVESTTICKELRRINEMIGRRFADRRLKNGEKVERPRAQGGKKVRVVASNREDTLELDEFFREWQEPLRALKKDLKAMLDVEEHIRMSNKSLTVYHPESGIKEGQNAATVTAQANVQLVGQAMTAMGMVVVEQGEDDSLAPGPASPPTPSPSDPPAHLVEYGGEDSLAPGPAPPPTSSPSDPPAHVLEPEDGEGPDYVDNFGPPEMHPSEDPFGDLMEQEPCGEEWRDVSNERSDCSDEQSEAV